MRPLSGGRCVAHHQNNKGINSVNNLDNLDFFPIKFSKIDQIIKRADNHQNTDNPPESYCAALPEILVDPIKRAGNFIKWQSKIDRRKTKRHKQQKPKYFHSLIIADLTKKIPPWGEK